MLHFSCNFEDHNPKGLIFSTSLFLIIRLLHNIKLFSQIYVINYIKAFNKTQLLDILPPWEANLPLVLPGCYYGRNNRTM